MRIFGRLIKQLAPDHEQPPAAPASTSAKAPRFGRISDGLYQLATSRNGRYTLGWRDATGDGTRGGFRESGHGAYILLDGQREVVRGRLERPNDGHVADDGRFVLTDWHFGSRLVSTFYVFDVSGHEILRESFPVNAGGSAISADGRWTALSLLANPAEPELSNLLLTYNVDGRIRHWQQQLPLVVRELELDPDRDALLLFAADNHTLQLRLSDGWFDPAELRRTRFAISPYTIVEVITEELKRETGSEAQLEQWESELAAAEPPLRDRPKWLARIVRIRAEFAEHRGDAAMALELYQHALELDPGIGVRRRIEALGGAAPPAPARPAQASAVDERPYALTACPYCGAALRPLPRAKKRCPSCGRPVYVRVGPDARRHLLREDQLGEHDAWWERSRVAAAMAEEHRVYEQNAADRAAGILVGDNQPEVVGESHYQDALRRLAGPHGADGARATGVAELVPQPDNPYDRNAVALFIDGELVGHLARNEATMYSRPLQKRRQRGLPATCRVRIIGGRSHGRSHYGVFIDGIPHSDELD